MDAPRRTFANWGSRLFFTTILAVYVVIVAGVLIDPPPTEGPKGPGIPLLILAGLALLLARVLRLGITLDSDELILRSWFRTRRIPRADVSKVEAIGYSGLLNRGSTSRQLKLLALTIDQRTVAVRAVLGRARRIDQLADALSDALGLARPLGVDTVRRDGRRDVAPN